MTSQGSLRDMTNRVQRDAGDKDDIRGSPRTFKVWQRFATFVNVCSASRMIGRFPCQCLTWVRNHGEESLERRPGLEGYASKYGACSADRHLKPATADVERISLSSGDA